MIVDLAQEPEHIPLLASWHHQQWRALNPGDTLERRIERMQAYLDAALIPSTFIYKRDQRLAGSAAIIACDMDCHPELGPWLASVYVAPAWRRQGIASQLVNHVMQQARAAGLSHLYLFTPDQRDFYQRLGWQSLFDTSYHQHAVTVMQAKLF